MHTNKDNISYDASIHSQLIWSKHLKLYPCTFYFNLVGKLDDKSFMNLEYPIKYLLKIINYQSPTSFISGVDTSNWGATGNDGLLEVYTQEYPFRLILDKTAPRYQINQIDFIDENFVKGEWLYMHKNISHISLFLGHQSIWENIYVILDKMKSYEYKKPSSFRKYANNTNKSDDDRPDMQKISVKITQRYFIRKKAPGDYIFFLQILIISYMMYSRDIFHLALFFFSLFAFYFYSSDHVELIFSILRLTSQIYSSADILLISESVILHNLAYESPLRPESIKRLYSFTARKTKFFIAIMFFFNFDLYESYFTILKLLDITNIFTKSVWILQIYSFNDVLVKMNLIVSWLCCVYSLYHLVYFHFNIYSDSNLILKILSLSSIINVAFNKIQDVSSFTQLYVLGKRFCIE